MAFPAEDQHLQERLCTPPATSQGEILCLHLMDFKLKLHQRPYSRNGLESADVVWDQDPPNKPSPNPLRLPTQGDCKREKNPPKTRDLSNYE